MRLLMYENSINKRGINRIKKYNNLFLIIANSSAYVLVFKV